jgi:hypothetical protein
MLLAAVLLAGCGGREETPPAGPAAAAPAGSAPAPATEERAGSAAAGAAATATGGGGTAATDGNRPPKVVAVAFKDPYIRRGIDIEVTPEAEDPDYDLLSFRYHWFVNGEKQDDLDGPVLPGDRFRKGDRIDLRVVPFDGKAEGPSFFGDPFTVPNAPPRFVTTPPLAFKAHVYTYAARAEDPDGDPLTYTLEAGPAGMAIDDRGGVSWTIAREQAGVHTVRIVATEAEGLRAVQEFSVTITVDAEEAK